MKKTGRIHAQRNAKPILLARMRQLLDEPNHAPDGCAPDNKRQKSDVET